METQRTNLTPISMLLPPSTLAALDKAAATDGRSRSAMAGRLIETALGENDSRAASAMAAGGQ